MGNQDLFHTMLDVTMPGGTVVTVAHGDHGIDHVRERLAFHVDPVKGSIGVETLCEVTGLLFQRLVRHGRHGERNGFPIERIITNYFPITEAKEAYCRVSEGLEGKVILTQ